MISTKTERTLPMDMATFTKRLRKEINIKNGWFDQSINAKNPAWANILDGEFKAISARESGENVIVTVQATRRASWSELVQIKILRFFGKKN